MKKDFQKSSWRLNRAKNSTSEKALAISHKGWQTFFVSRNPETLKAWKEANRERIREQGRNSYHRNKTSVSPEEKQRKLEYQRKWRAENRDEILGYARQWYDEHRGVVAEQRKVQRYKKRGPPKIRTRMSPEDERASRVIYSRRGQERRQLLYWTLKSKFTCLDCGENDPACLQFHHRDPSQKLMNIGHKGKCSSTEKLLAEIVKCDVLCANCHRKHHYLERGGFTIKHLTEEEMQSIRQEAEVLYEKYVQHFVN